MFCLLKFRSHHQIFELGRVRSVPHTDLNAGIGVGRSCRDQEPQVLKLKIVGELAPIAHLHGHFHGLIRMSSYLIIIQLSKPNSRFSSTFTKKKKNHYNRSRIMS